MGGSDYGNTPRISLNKVHKLATEYSQQMGDHMAACQGFNLAIKEKAVSAKQSQVGVGCQ